MEAVTRAVSWQGHGQLTRDARASRTGPAVITATIRHIINREYCWAERITLLLDAFFSTVLIHRRQLRKVRSFYFCFNTFLWNSVTNQYGRLLTNGTRNQDPAQTSSHTSLWRNYTIRYLHNGKRYQNQYIKGNGFLKMYQNSLSTYIDLVNQYVCCKLI